MVKKDLSEAVQTCEANKKITEDTNANLQKDRDDIDRKFSTLKLRYASQCVPIARQTNTTSSGAGTVAANGITAEALFEFTRTHCSSYRSQRVQLESFIDAERK